MDDLSAITQALADVDEQLRALPDNAFARKYELLTQQDRLRERAAAHAVDADRARPTEDLLAELSGLRFQLAQIESQKIDLVTQAGGGAQGAGNMGNLGGVQLNAQMAEAMGAGKLQARIGVIKGILTDRGTEIPPAR